MEKKEGQQEETTFKSPLDAYSKSKPEELLYVVTLPGDRSKRDYLSTIDVNPQSKTYQQIINRLEVPNSGDELHHTGWNACVSCHENQTNRHKYLIMPGLKSGNIYVVDVQKDPRNPSLAREISAQELSEATGGGSFPNNVHCLPTGEVMVSLLGKNGEEAQGGFAIIDAETLKVKGRWESKEETSKLPFGYDFWFQPRYNIMVSTEFGTPKYFWKGFHVTDAVLHYGSHLVFWDWKERKVINKVSLGLTGADSMGTLGIRFLHNPDSPFGFTVASLSANLIKVYPNQITKVYEAKKIAEIPSIKVRGWELPMMPANLSDLVISLDDRYLYASCYFHGTVLQYDITDTDNPKLVGKVFVGGLLRKENNIMIVDDDGNDAPGQLQEIPLVKGKRLEGGPHMLQLSRDGKRLYVSSSLITPWDAQFYPEMLKQGGQIVKINVNTEKGGLTLDSDFLIDLSNEPQGPAVAHEIRYPGGDCTSDIWV